MPSREFRALYNFTEPGVEPDPGQRRGHTPVFYDPATGVPAQRSIGSRVRCLGGGFARLGSGKLAAGDEGRLPGLSVCRRTLPINEKQTSTAFDKAIAQDLDAPLRGFPGSELRGPGATGIAASGGHATLPAPALKRFLEDNNGRVLVDNTGARHVLALGP